MSVHYSKEQRAIAHRDNKALVTIAMPGFSFQGAVNPEDVQPLNEFVMKWITSRYKPAVTKPQQIELVPALVARFTYKDGTTYEAKAMRRVRGLAKQINGEYCRPVKLSFSRNISDVLDFMSDAVAIAKLKQWITDCQLACTPNAEFEVPE